MTVLIGHDSEVFLKDATTGELVSAIDELGGTKEAPKPLGVGYIQEDNVLAEFNINPTASCDTFVQHTMSMLKSINDLVHERGLTTHISSSAPMPVDALMHPASMVFGCEPDFDAWRLCENIGPDPFEVGQLRTGAGHIHVDIPGIQQNPQLGVCVVRALDKTLGCASVLLDEDRQRRMLYGKAGAYRPKPYGVEYRVLGNFWLKSEEYMRFVFDVTQDVVATQIKESYPVSPQKVGLVIGAINLYKEADARQILEESLSPKLWTKYKHLFTADIGTKS